MPVNTMPVNEHPPHEAPAVLFAPESVHAYLNSQIRRTQTLSQMPQFKAALPALLMIQSEQNTYRAVRQALLGIPFAGTDSPPLLSHDIVYSVTAPQAYEHEANKNEANKNEANKNEANKNEANADLNKTGVYHIAVNYLPDAPAQEPSTQEPSTQEPSTQEKTAWQTLWQSLSRRLGLG